MYDNNIILFYLNNPSRIAFWTGDEVSALFIPVSIGCLFKFPMIGLILSISSYIILKHIKQNIAGGFLRHAVCWYLPMIYKNMKIKIPSYIREYIG